MQPLSLLWHQRVGVAALADKMWLKKENLGGVPGVLVADEVGVGKTALMMGAIAMIIDAYWAQEVAAGRGKLTGITVDLNKTNVHKAPMLGELVSLSSPPRRTQQHGHIPRGSCFVEPVSCTRYSTD